MGGLPLPGALSVRHVVLSGPAIWVPTLVAYQAMPAKESFPLST